MSTWKYSQHGQPKGPIDTATLVGLIEQGALQANTLVWREGMIDWVPAYSLPELSAALAGSKPPPPSVPLPPAGPPPPASATNPDAADIEKNKVFAVLAYIGFLFLVPLLAAPQSRFARYHANQGTVLFLATIIATMGSVVLAMIPFLGCLFMLLVPLAGVASLVLMVMGIIHAAAGECKPLPFIGHFEVIK